jgi:hypothetical protein
MWGAAADSACRMRNCARFVAPRQHSGCRLHAGLFKPVAWGLRKLADPQRRCDPWMLTACCDVLSSSSGLLAVRSDYPDQTWSFIESVDLAEGNYEDIPK